MTGMLETAPVRFVTDMPPSKAPMAKESPALRRAARRLSALAGLVTSAMGAVVLLGWQFHAEPLKRLSSELVSMNPVTALCFIFLGLPLALPRRARPITIALTLAA